MHVNQEPLHKPGIYPQDGGGFVMEYPHITREAKTRMVYLPFAKTKVIVPKAPHPDRSNLGHSLRYTLWLLGPS